MTTDPRISPIFYYFEKHTTIASGRTLGRKLGGVQEIILRKLLLSSPFLADSLLFEQPLLGQSGATHKVEFSFHPSTEYAELSMGDTFRLHGTDGRVAGSTQDGISIVLLSENPTQRFTLRPHASTRLPGPGHFRLKLVHHSNSRVRLSVLNADVVLASIESKRVGAQRFSGSDKLGAGIQTIEKAKQAALVAIDIDIRENGTIQPLASQHGHYLSFVVLGNGIHWTPKDLSVLCTYVAHVYLIPDRILIRYSDYIRGQADAKSIDFFEYFMSYFQGKEKTPEDAFTVIPTELEHLCLEGDQQTILAVLETHLRAYKPPS